MKHLKRFMGLHCSIILIIFMILSGCRSLGIRSIPLETLKKKYKVSDADFITVKGVDIHYRDEGSGPPLILLHGICASLYTWDGWTEQLKDKYRVIRLDVPGWGFTGPVGEDSYNLEKMIEIMEEFVASLGIDSFYMAGNSLGGYFCWNYAVVNPEQVKKLVLLDPVCYPQSTPWFINVASVPVLRSFPTVFMPKFLISMNVRSVYGDTSRIADDTCDLYFDLAMREGNRSSYMDTFRFMAQESKKETLSRRVTELSVPVLLMYGKEDKWVPPGHATLWKRDVPFCETIIYEGVGHVPMEEIPVKTSTDADMFFSRGWRLLKTGSQLN